MVPSPSSPQSNRSGRPSDSDSGSPRISAGTPRHDHPAPEAGLECLLVQVRVGHPEIEPEPLLAGDIAGHVNHPGRRAPVRPIPPRFPVMKGIPRPTHSVQHDVEVASDVVVGGCAPDPCPDTMAPQSRRTRIGRPTESGPFALQHVDEPRRDRSRGCRCNRWASHTTTVSLLKCLLPPRPAGLAAQIDAAVVGPLVTGPLSSRIASTERTRGPRHRPRSRHRRRAITTPYSFGGRFHRNLAVQHIVQEPGPGSRSSGSPYPPPPRGVVLDPLAGAQRVLELGRNLGRPPPPRIIAPPATGATARRRTIPTAPV